jgi:hypothetical protein
LVPLWASVPELPAMAARWPFFGDSRRLFYDST